MHSCIYLDASEYGDVLGMFWRENLRVMGNVCQFGVTIVVWKLFTVFYLIRSTDCNVICAARCNKSMYTDTEKNKFRLTWAEIPCLHTKPTCSSYFEMDIHNLACFCGANSRQTFLLVVLWRRHLSSDFSRGEYCITKLFYAHGLWFKVWVKKIEAIALWLQRRDELVFFGVPTLPVPQSNSLLSPRFK